MSAPRKSDAQRVMEVANLAGDLARVARLNDLPYPMVAKLVRACMKRLERDERGGVVLRATRRHQQCDRTMLRPVAHRCPAMARWVDPDGGTWCDRHKPRVQNGASR